MQPKPEQPPCGSWPYILPFVLFMGVSLFEPAFPADPQDALELAEIAVKNAPTVAEQYVLSERQSLANHFFLVYGLKVILVTATLVFFWRSYLRQFPLSATWLSVGVGVVGIVVWVGLCSLGLEKQITDLWTKSGTSLRSHFNPFVQLPVAWQQVAFLAVRFFGLVIMVPICEELLLRGFLMRYIESPDWWQVNLGRLSLRTMMVAPLYGLATHPAEAIAAVAWFGLVTWLVHRTGKFWDAVIAHAVTNLLLGLYVCIWAQWHFW